MALFKSREERKQIREERRENIIKEFFNTRNLDNLAEEDKEFVNLIREEIESTTGYRVRGTEGEIALIEQMDILIEQNWLIIKLLNEISQRLNK